MGDICKNKCNFVKFEADNIIYNRFDLIYSKNVESFSYEYEDKMYIIDAYYENSRAVINIWGKQLPSSVFENIVADIFEHHSEIRCIDIKRTISNYKQLLNEYNDIRIPLPETVEQLLQRVRGKHRSTIKRIKRILEEEYGTLEMIMYKSDIPDEIVNQYFLWKQITHGTDYHMLPKEYLRNYHVTDAILLKAGMNGVAILFFCQVENIVYLENLSYNIELEKFSPGYLVYVMFLEELIYRKCSSLYLGGGEYMYKKRFGAEESITYSGTIFRKEVFNDLNCYFNKSNIKKVAIYGLGMVGHSLLRIVDHLDINITYGIDREIKQMEKLQVCSLEDNFEEVDAVFITLKSHAKGVEDFLKTKFAKVYYWGDILSKVIDNGRG